MRWNPDRQRLRCSPTDLANFLGCRHRTMLDVRGARGELAIPRWVDPLADALRQRGLDHERRYLDTVRQEGHVIEDLTDVPSELAERRLLDAMGAGADVIVQAPLGGDGWFGYADVLRRVEGNSALGPWHYEALDTKLSRETKGGTILQLCVYTELLSGLQGRLPDHFSVVTPISAERYRFDDFAAFYRFVKARFMAFVSEAPAQTYPEPVSHCDVCRWDERCRARRRADDHLSYVAGLGRLQRAELEGRDISTLAALAGIPVPLEFRPRRGSRETYERLREQARLQDVQRTTRVPTYELLPVALRTVDPARPEAAQREGLLRLPEPSPRDLFLDLEGDPFAREGGREYLFGLIGAGESVNSPSTYSSWWAVDDAQERVAFEQVVDRIMTTLASDPGMHVYHYAPYEPAAFKRLSGRHATRGEEVDTLLRGGRFVDLYAIVRQALRAGVESYSIKSLEPFYGFTRDVDLRHAGDQRRVVEVALELGDLVTLTPVVKEAVEGYNRDDCRSTAALRDWLERLRADHIAAGVDVSRPPLVPGDPNPEVNERDRMAARLRDQLLARSTLSPEEQDALHLLAYMVDWHRREERVAWGEYHRLREQSDDDLLDEPAALAGMTFEARVFEPAGRRTSPVDRYRYPFQENGISAGDAVKLKDDSPFGTVEAIDKQGLTIDIRKPKDRAGVHPDVVIAQTIRSCPAQEESIRRTALAIAERGLEGPGADRLVNALLRGLPPRLVAGRFDDPGLPVEASDRAVQLVGLLDESVLAIQGPPGAGKTYTGARMIAALVARGRKVGVVATGHKVIRKLIVDAVAEAGRQGITMLAAHKPGEDDLPVPDGMTIEQPNGNDQAQAWLAEAGGRVLGGTAWLWSRPEFEKSVDVLFVDEAGQMSLANVLAVTPAARSLVLLGDPQQLEQPKKGSHPDRVDVSALEHLLGGHATMPDDRGIFLPVTWRLAPEVCEFTSEVFYEGKLRSRVRDGERRLVGSSPLAPSRFEGAGLRVVETVHEGCRNASDEEVLVVADVVAELVSGALAYRDTDGPDRRLALDDVLVVAPYNAQVARLRDALDARFGAGARVGTVDKFQGQEAPVVIYSMTSSRPEDAPRGMEFLYSLNRLNVATSRAKALCILVASRHLFAPECRTPRQMQLASALCRYRELAGIVR